MHQRNLLSVPPVASARILSVSPDKILGEIRQAILSRTGYRVTHADNASDAVSELASRNFDLLILCQTIPCKERKILLSESKAKNVPVLSVTTAPVGKPCEVGSLEGAACFIAKVKELTPHAPQPSSGKPNTLAA
ncbi:MAG: hypothetical protein JWO13_743 [Acidobacteriales bacterium]|nr:hypothetical protein [Terriglobales bacterium]